MQAGKRQRVLVLPLGREVQALLGEGLLEALTRAGIPLRSDCGGLGICGRCRVRFQGKAPAPTPFTTGSPSSPPPTGPSMGRRSPLASWCSAWWREPRRRRRSSRSS
ncbi:MAG: hypothetical protein B1H11_05640 [Desulfobacteraceae bacterium 4484_190.1]|nr:MAG: hypothetical protein B1H11_05640 [Desulfobacteraceae bacterium 4484_190.1]